eukprot:403353346
MLYDHQVEVIQTQVDYKGFCEVIEEMYTPGASTCVHKPFDYLQQHIEQNNAIQKIKGIFLIDGDDMYPEETQKSLQTFKTYISDKNIQCKFSVIGLGEHDPKLMKQILNLQYYSNDVEGPYHYIDQYVDEGDLQKVVLKAFRDSRKQLKFERGLVLDIGFGKKIKANISKISEQIVSLSVSQLLIEREGLEKFIAILNQESFKNVFELENQETSLKPNYDKLILLQQQILEIDQRSKLEDISQIIKSKISQISQLLQKEQNPLQIQKISELQKDYQNMLNIVSRQIQKGESEHLYPHFQIQVETIKNSSMRRDYLYRDEIIYRVSDRRIMQRETDFPQIEEIYQKLIEFKCPITQVRALDRGVQQLYKLGDFLESKLRQENYLLKKKKKFVKLNERISILSFRFTVKKFFMDVEQKLDKLSFRKKELQDQRSKERDQVQSQNPQPSEKVNLLPPIKIYEPDYTDFQLSQKTHPETIFEILQEKYQLCQEQIQNQGDIDQSLQSQIFIFYETDQRDIFDQGYKMFKEIYPEVELRFTGISKGSQNTNIPQTGLTEKSESDELIFIKNEYGRKVSARARKVWFN